MKVGDLVRNGPICGMIIGLDLEYSQSENLNRFYRECKIANIKVLLVNGNAYWEREQLLEVVSESR